MKLSSVKQFIFLLVSGFVILWFNGKLNAQQSMNTHKALDDKQRSIVTISAFTANGNQGELQQSLNEGLNAGLTINEIKEAIVQLYAYAGFPRSLNALHTLMAVLKDRESKNIKDVLGKEASPLPTDKTKLQFGTEMQTKLVGQPVKGEVYEFAPAIDSFLKQHLFGDIFGRDNLDWRSREIATIAALATLGGTENQLRSHINVGMYNGLSAAQLNELVDEIETAVDKHRGNTARLVLQSVLEKKPYKAEAFVNEKIFPTGQAITNGNFTGNAWLSQLIQSDSTNSVSVGNVTFEPGAKTKWHLHPAGQILLVTEGIGYYQEKGQPKKTLRKGDALKCPPNVPHWHGASEHSSFVQIAITGREKGEPVWLQAVTDEEYKN